VHIVRFRPYILAILLTAGVTVLLWVFRAELTPANFSLIYLLTVLVLLFLKARGLRYWHLCSVFWDLTFFWSNPIIHFT
jgi:K+-sensing histidine kinase KdpD